MSKTEEVLVNKHKYLLLCIDILKAPEGLVNSMTKELQSSSMYI